MTSRRIALTVLLAALGAGGLQLSGASFTASSANPANSFGAAADWTSPNVTLTDPGSPLKATVSLSATASDDVSGVASVTIQRRPAGGSTWTDVCTDTGSPFACSLDTATVATPDGLYDLRAVAIDGAANSATSAVVADRRIDNTAPTVTLTDPGAMGGSVTLASTTADASGSGVASVRYQYATAGAGTWTDACTASATPFSCSFNTTTPATPDGQYDLRAIVTDGAGNATTSATVAGRWIDNAAPTGVTMGDPGTLLQGTDVFSGAATDAGSGVASLKFQTRRAGESTWVNACTDTTAPYSCSFDTATLADGDYDLRSLATDNAGRETASSVYTSRKVDNNAPTSAITTLGGYLAGNTVQVAASASDGAGSGVASVKLQYRASGGSSWTDICTDTAAPYECTFNTKAGGTPDGLYEFRALAADNASLSAGSQLLTATIDNTRPKGDDVQSENGGATAGVIEPGDKLHLFYSETMLASSILTGWNGSATGVTVRFLDAIGGDRIEVYDAPNTTRLNLIAAQKYISLVADYVPASGAVFNATMVRSGGTVSLTLGTLASGGVNSTAPAAGIMEWSPSSLSTDLAGNTCQTATVFELVLEGGSLDAEF